MEVKVDSCMSGLTHPTSPDSLENNGTPEPSPETPNPTPMAFTIDFGGGKAVDKSRLSHLAKQSQARHQRVQSMSASLQRTSPTAVTPQKPPMSAKLPRKAQGYNSEGYFSSDQEDSFLSGSTKLRQSPLAQNNDFKPHSFTSSPLFDKSRRTLYSPTQKSKTPIFDSIMSRSDTMPSKHNLNLPLKSAITSSYNDVHSPNYSFGSYNSRILNSILDQSPDGVLLTDISSPDLEVATPENLLNSPEKSPKRDVPDLFKKCVARELEIVEDTDKQSEHSSTGTYTIEAEYSEEKKARMSIDRTFGVDLLKESINDALNRRSVSKDRDPELILDTAKLNKGNVLEINCYYEPDLSEQTTKQIKSTRNYLEKIKNRVRTISESLKPSKTNSDEGSFTSVTTSGVLAKQETNRRRLSLSKSRIDQTDYVHRLSRESSVPVCLPSEFESTVMRAAHSKVCDPNGDEIVGKLSHLSLNRCRGDQTWIRDWAESVKVYNEDMIDEGSFLGCGDPIPASPKHLKNHLQVRTNLSNVSKIPSPISRNRSPRVQEVQDTSSYLIKTQNAISNLQAKMSKSPEHIPQALSNSTIDRATNSRLPVSQLSRSNSLNYRLKRKELDSPLRSPGNYVITGSQTQGKLLLTHTSRSLDAEKRDSNMHSPNSERTHSSETNSYRTLKHNRNRSFEGRNSREPFNNISLKTVLKNNAYGTKIDGCHGDSIKRSSSFNAVNRNNNYLKKEEDFSDESDYTKTPQVRYNRTLALRRDRFTPDKQKPSSPKYTTDAGRNTPARAAPRQPNQERLQRLSEPRTVRDKSAGRFERVNQDGRLKSRSSTREPPRRFEKDGAWTRTSGSPGRMVARDRRPNETKPKFKCTEISARLSSPVHRSQSFHSPIGVALDYSSDDEQMSREADSAMITSTHSEILRPNINCTYRAGGDKRRTFVLDSDNNSTNESSARLSHEKTSVTTGPSDTDCESGAECGPGASDKTRSRLRSTPEAGKPVQPRYLDISRYQQQQHAPQKQQQQRRRDTAGKGSARSIEIEQKKAELEKWKRRASYDPRKAAAAAKTRPAKSNSVLRSQSFHGPVSASMTRYVPSRHIPEYGDDYTSDNDF